MEHWIKTIGVFLFYFNICDIEWNIELKKLGCSDLYGILNLKLG